MRSDMAKLMVERPRRAWDGMNRTVRRDRAARRSRDADAQDALPRTGPMEPRDGSRKWFGENFAPLVRYLRSQVGRPWDAVYSEIRAHLTPSSTVQMHVIQHLFQYVERNVVLDGDTVRPNPHLGPRRWADELRDDGQTFYVHPVTGLLRRPKAGPWRRVREEATPERVDLGDGRFHMALEGEWFLVETAPVVQGTARDHTPRDLVLKTFADAGNLADRRKLYGGKDVFAVSKRQLSRRELRDAGLR